MAKRKSEKVWRIMNGMLVPASKASESKVLENKVYILKQHPDVGLYLEEVGDNFEMPEKIYDIEESFIERVIRTWNNTNTNIGILLNGLKGTGKTMTAKMISNQINQPVVMITAPYPGVAEFIGMIWQECTIFLDEYEKLFLEQKEGVRDVMLTAMDGIFTGEHRKLFLLTTNELRVSQYMVSRPGRIRYIKEFQDLRLETVIEIVSDLLKPELMYLKDDTIKYISRLEMLTVDIVKSVVEEVNIHEESPEIFLDVFNVKKGDETVNAIIMKFNGMTSNKYYVGMQPALSSIMEDDELEDALESNLYIDNSHIGRIIAIDLANSIVITKYRGFYSMIKWSVTGTANKSFSNVTTEADEYGIRSNWKPLSFTATESKKFLDWARIAMINEEKAGSCPFGVSHDSIWQDPIKKLQAEIRRASKKIGKERKISSKIVLENDGTISELTKQLDENESERIFNRVENGSENESYIGTYSGPDSL